MNQENQELQELQEKNTVSSEEKIERNMHEEPEKKYNLPTLRTFSQKQQVGAGLALCLLAGAIGYGAILQPRIEERRDLQTQLSSLHAQKQDEADREDDFYGVENSGTGEIFLETEVSDAVMNYITNDPYVGISSQLFDTDATDNGVLSLYADYTGTVGELSMFLQNLSLAPKKIQLENLYYQKDFEGNHYTSMELRIPYVKGDGSLLAQNFVTTFDQYGWDTTTDPAPIAPPTVTTTPGENGSTSTESTYTPSYTPSTPSYTPSTPSYSPSYRTPSRPYTPPAHQKQYKRPTSPEKEPDRERYAVNVLQYSVVETFPQITLADGTEVAKTDLEKQAYQISFPKVGEETPLSGEIQFRTEGVYLPRNGKEVSIDLSAPSLEGEDFTLVLADLEGNNTEVKPSRKIDLGDNFYRVFFPLDKMDGTVRLNTIRYQFAGRADNEQFILRNFQIISEE